MERKLASVQVISSLDPIGGADKIVKATVLGWEVVVLKSDFSVGDRCVYCEVDSILPERNEFEFLRSRKFRIKTIKLKGQVSQGICFPLSILPLELYDVGDDVTKILGVKKYDPQYEAERKEIERLNELQKNRLKKYFMRYTWFRRLVYRPERLPRPAFVRKTDEDRIQLFPNICTEEKRTLFHETEKLDGTSASYFLVKKGRRLKYGICSRNFQILKRDKVYWAVSDKYDIKTLLTDILRRYSADIVVIQGEIIGPGVQGNKYKRDELSLWLFNLKIDHDKYITPESINRIVDWTVPTVPLLSVSYTLPNTIPEAVRDAEGESILYNIPREGVVLRDAITGRSLKIINPKFLLKYDE